MREITLNKKKLCLYDSIDEIPIENYWKAKELWQLENEIPQIPSDIARFYQDLSQFIDKGMTNEAKTKLNNLMMGHINIANSIDHRSLVFACMVYSWQGVKIEFSDSNNNLKSLMKDLSKEGLTFGKVVNEVQDLKKKLINSL